MKDRLRGRDGGGGTGQCMEVEWEGVGAVKYGAPVEFKFSLTV